MNKEEISKFEDSLLEVLNKVDEGKIKLDPKQVEQAKNNWVECPNCRFDIGKFTFIIFNDCEEWDYISEAWRGGKKTTNHLIRQHMLKLDEWRPKHPEYWGMNKLND